MSETTPLAPAPPPKTINALASTAHTLFALGSDNAIYYSDDYRTGWKALSPAFPGTGPISAICANRWPGPSANLYLFVSTSTQLWRYDRDSGSWLSVPYLS
jgi:hypothetical protein